MLDLPTGRSDRVGTRPVCRPDDEEENTTSSKGKATSSKVTNSKAQQPPNDGSDSDEQAAAFHPKGGFRILGLDKDKIRDAATTLACERQLPMSERPKRRLPRPYPEQFPREIFDQRGLLYSAPKSINYDSSRDYSVEELKDACRRFPLQGWEKWCDQPKDIFLKWMLNEMGAFMSLARRDPLKPTEDLAKGFDEWKKEQNAKMYRKRMIEVPEFEQEAKRRAQLSRACKK